MCNSGGLCVFGLFDGGMMVEALGVEVRAVFDGWCFRTEKRGEREGLVVVLCVYWVVCFGF